MNRFFTGKLGSGKTLIATGVIRDYLRKGLPVATNLDIRLDRLIGKQKRKTRLIRLPDKPEPTDLEMLGYGNESPDESKNGLIVLDECGTWFNSRTWNDKSRQLVIDWMLHARKLGWDVVFLIQDISMVDKQAREGLAELVGYCRRMDRLTVPFIGTLIQMLTGIRIKLPSAHLCIVKYGYAQGSIIVERMLYRGADLYKCYDTKQIFKSNPPYAMSVIPGGADGSFSYLPPWFWSGRYSMENNRENLMRLTRIMWRRFSRPSCFAGGVVFAVLALSLWFGDTLNPADVVLSPGAVPVVQVDEFFDNLVDFKIVGFRKYPAQAPVYQLSDGSITISSSQLVGMGYAVKGGSNEKIIVYSGDKFISLYRG